MCRPRIHDEFVLDDWSLLMYSDLHSASLCIFLLINTIFLFFYHMFFKSFVNPLTHIFCLSW